MRKLTWILLWALLAWSGATGDVRAATARQRVEIQMKEFAFVPSTVTLKSGVPAEVRLGNRGVVEHEWMVYEARGTMGMHSEKMHKQLEARSYFRGLAMQVEGRAKQVERMGRDVVMITLAPGQSVTLRFTPSKRGTFEMACQLPGHHEAGMKGSWVVR